jgi:pimeloyl-ACP methyl ester carboxylesterase
LGVRETDLELQSGDDICRAWFFTPDGAAAPRPCIVMGHGFGLTRECSLREFALAFAGAGYAVLLFDYRGFGDSGGAPRQLVSVRKQLEDWQAVIEFARAQREVDSNRIVTWGFSLGGGHALSAAARNENVTAVIAVAPMFDGLSSTLAAVRRWSPLAFLRIIGRGLQDLIGSWFGRPPTMVPITASPGELCLLASPDAYPGYRAIVPRDFNYEIPARVALLLWTYRPGLMLRRFSRSTLVLPSKIDKINPPGPIIRRSRDCKFATIIELDCEHMDIATEPHRSQIVRSTLDFLRQCVPSGQIQ